MSSAEGLADQAALDEAGVKAVVSHQHRYGEHYQKVKEIIASGALGQGAHRVRHGDRLDGAHAHPPDRLHVAGSTTTAGRVGHGAGRRAAASSRTSIRRRITSPASCNSRTACAASTSAARARPTCPRWLLVAQEPHRRAGHRRLRRSAHRRRLARSHEGRRAVRGGHHELRPRHAALRAGHGRLAGRRHAGRIRCDSSMRIRASRSCPGSIVRPSMVARSPCR